MKAVASTENCQQPRTYCVWWARVGGPDRFRHRVLAASLDDAICQSRLHIAKALGPNASLWTIEEPSDKTTRAIPTAAVDGCERARRSSQRAGIVAFVLLFLGLLFLFEWKSRTVGSASYAENDTASESSSSDESGACREAQCGGKRTVTQK